jgi:transposase
MSINKYIKDTVILNTEKNRFYSKVLLPNENGCMMWTGCKSHQYGVTSVKRRNVLSHRYSYKLHYNDIPNSLHVLHKCDVPLCVNPEHLFLGTASDNMKDMAKKNRSRKGDRHHNVKISDLQLNEIKEMLLNGTSQLEISKKYNVSQTSISHIKTGRTRNKLNDEERKIIDDIEYHKRKNIGVSKRKLNEEQVREIRYLLLQKLSCEKIAKRYCVYRTVINCIKSNKTYINIGNIA